MFRQNCSRSHSYAVAAGSVAIALLVAWPVSTWVPRPDEIFTAAVAVTAWYGGMLPALVSAVLASLALQALMLTTGNDPVFDAHAWLQMGLFVMVAVLISSLFRRTAQQREWLSVTLGSIGDAVIATDASGRVCFINPAAEALTGYLEEDALDKHVDEIFRIVNEQTQQAATSPIARVLHEGCTVGLANSIALLSRDGQKIPIEDSAAPIRSANGQIIGAVMVFHDVTARRRQQEALRESEARERARATELQAMMQERERHTERWKTLVRLSSEIMTQKSLQPLLERVAEGARELTGACAACAGQAFQRDGRYEVGATSKAEGLSPCSHCSICKQGHGEALLELLRNKRTARLTQDELRRDPRHWNLLKAHAPLRSLLAARLTGREDQPQGVLLVSNKADGSDFTVEDEAALAELAALTSLFTQQMDLRQEAEHANRIKDEFLAMLSHELRTPLTAILGWVRMLQDDNVDREKIAAGLQVIDRNTRAQTRIIEDLLDVSRIVVGKLVLNIEQVDVLKVLEAAVQSVSPAAEAKAIHLERSWEMGEHLVRGDAERIQQIIYNLLSNAIKFTPKGGQVKVRLGRDGSSALIEVSDNGIGVDADFLPHVFDRFRQADGSITRKYRGLGLGLAIVRHLAELHGGTVSAESKGKDKGAKFSVRLPIGALRQRSSASARHALPVLNKPSGMLSGERVLIVEDEPDSRDLLLAVIAGNGAEVRGAGSADDCFHALDDFKPTLLVCDIGLPGMDGYELIRRLRESKADRGGRVPAIALTAYAKPADRSRALAAGFQKHLPKPVDPDELVAAVAELRGSLAVH